MEKMSSNRKPKGASKVVGRIVPAFNSGPGSTVSQNVNNPTKASATAASKQADGDSDFDVPLKAKRVDDGKKKEEKKEVKKSEGKDGKVVGKPAPLSKKRVKRWREIESNPHVFSEMLKTMGVEGSSMQEVWDIDSMPDMVQNGDVYGLILLIRWSTEEEQIDRSQMDIKAPVYFAQQVVQNACATQALVAVALNTPGLNIGPRLAAFKERTKHLSYFTRGQALGDSTFLHAIHCHYSGSDGIEYEEIKEEEQKKPGKKKGENKKEGKTAKTDGKEAKKPKKRQRKKKMVEEELYEMPFHFITIIPASNGIVYELDGLKDAPRTLGSHNQKDPSDWLRVAREAIILRFAATDDLEFQLMAVTESPPRFHARMVKDLEQKLASETAGEGENGKKKGKGGRGKPTEEEREKRAGELRKQIAEHKEKMEGNPEEKEDGLLEVARAIHNYDRFIEAFTISVALKGFTVPEEVERLRAARKKREEERVRKHKEDQEKKRREEEREKNGEEKKEGEVNVAGTGGEEQEKEGGGNAESENGEAAAAGEKEREDGKGTIEVEGVNARGNDEESKESEPIMEEEVGGREMEKMDEKRNEANTENMETKEKKEEVAGVVEGKGKRGRGEGTGKQRKGKKTKMDESVQGEGTVRNDGPVDMGGGEERVENVDEKETEKENEGKEETRKTEVKGEKEEEKESVQVEKNEEPNFKVESAGKEEMEGTTQDAPVVAEGKGKRKVSSRVQGGGGRKGRKGKNAETNLEEEEEENALPQPVEQRTERVVGGVGEEGVQNENENEQGEKKTEGVVIEEEPREPEKEGEAGIENKEEKEKEGGVELEVSEKTVEIATVVEGKSERKSDSRVAPAPLEETRKGRRKGKKVVMQNENEEKVEEKMEEGGALIGDEGGNDKGKKMESETPVEKGNNVETVEKVQVEKEGEGVENTTNGENAPVKTGQKEQVGTGKTQEEGGKDSEEGKGGRKEKRGKSAGRKGKPEEEEKGVVEAEGVKENAEGEKGKEGHEKDGNLMEHGEIGGVVPTKRGAKRGKPGKSEKEPAVETGIAGKGAKTAGETTGENEATEKEESGPRSMETSAHPEIPAKRGRGRPAKERKEEENVPASKEPEGPKRGRGRPAKEKKEDAPANKTEQEIEPSKTTAPVPETDEPPSSAAPEEIDAELETRPARTGRKRAAPSTPPPTDEPPAKKRGRKSVGRNTAPTESATTTEQTEPLPPEPQTNNTGPTRNDSDGPAGATDSEITADQEKSKTTPPEPENSEILQLEKTEIGNVGEGKPVDGAAEGSRKGRKERTPRKRKGEMGDYELAALHIDATFGEGDIAAHGGKRQRKEPVRLEPEMKKQSSHKKMK